MTATDTQVETDLIARTRALIPELASQRKQTAAARRVPSENIRLLRAAGSLKTVQATRNGGYGLGMRAHLDTISSLAEGCGSTAWVAGVVHAHSWLLSHFPARRRTTSTATTPTPWSRQSSAHAAAATRHVDGSYTLSGFWPFASGNENAEWLLLGAVVQRRERRRRRRGRLRGAHRRTSNARTTGS